MSDRSVTADDVLLALRCHIGRDRGISAVELVRVITGQTLADGVAARELRHVVEELRLQGEHVCAHPSRGYYLARNEAELNEACEFLYGRAMTSLRQVAAMKRVSLPDLKGQLKLPS